MALMSIPRTTDSFYQPHSIQTTFIASFVIWRQTAAILASSARASPCRRARRGATQPASARMRTPAKSSADGLFQPEVEALSRHPRGPTSFTIGCVNFGFQQSMMEGKRQCTYNLGCEAVCTKIVYDGDCDILFGCEVGAYGKGLAAANIELVTRNELAWTGAQPRRCPTPQCGAMSWRELLGPHLEEGRAKVLRVASDTLANGDPRPAADALEAGAAANPGAPGALSAAPFVFDTQLPGILRWLEPPWERRPFFCPSCFADTDSPFGYSCRLCLDISEPCMVARRWRMAVWQIRTS